ncbi:unnamed protein product [Vitrella brassicaformis CCMP3155]|uniref:U3 small nucleolar RNA-associated protein 15 C-terminal domain-containing protein n=1 Tax=Vitrella brassicaformis (strain CCMP3155) TaxID=1169540 RepID=A0A0G4G1K3_VITBC|nr:unnamed protein product [Vitrella brassicaformis CCMP3155]|eukprot:CEM21756.1 unnamed protein product [Vitrella brassicaformis CCMP3155]
MGEYRPLAVVSLPRRRQNTAPDQQQWKKYKVLWEGKEALSVNDMAFTPTTPHAIAVAHATKVEVYGVPSQSLLKSYTRFKDVVRAIDFRRDGRLFVASDDSGLVQVIDANAKVPLRKMKGHHGSVRSVRFCRDNLHVMSGGDDGTLRVWDISATSPLTTLKAHTDFVRAIDIADTNPFLVGSGSYDGTVRVWDTRHSSKPAAEQGEGQEEPNDAAAASAADEEDDAATSKQCLFRLVHGHPVESVLFMPAGRVVASAGGPCVKLWDLSSGGRMIRQIDAHSKAITGIALLRVGDGEEPVLVTASLDQTVKIHSMESYTVRHTFATPDALSCLAVSPRGDAIAAGMPTGDWFVRRRLDADRLNAVKQEEMEASRDEESELTTTIGYERAQKRRRVVAGSARFFAPDAEAITVDLRNKRKDTGLDKLLKSFQYQKALDRVCKGENACQIAALIEELRQRGALEIALRGKDPTTIEPILNFIHRQIGKEPILFDAAAHTLDVLLAENEWIYRQPDEKVNALLMKIKQFLGFERKLNSFAYEMQGAMDVILSGMP